MPMCTTAPHTKKIVVLIALLSSVLWMMIGVSLEAFLKEVTPAVAVAIPAVNTSSLAMPSGSLAKTSGIPAIGKVEFQSAHFAEVTRPWSNVTTLSFAPPYFYSGYRNQIMAFTVLVMQALQANHSQILLTRLRHKDTYGSEGYISHEVLFDVEHWNSHYPALPRLVTCNQGLHSDLDCDPRNLPKSTWRIEDPEGKTTSPYAYGVQNVMLAQYMRYSKGRGRFAKPKFRNPAELVMLQGGMRLHPNLIAVADRLITSMVGEGKEYMTLHARVEPDMQNHKMCFEKKERNLTKIFLDLEQQFPEPPASMVFMPINRELMEKRQNNTINGDPEKTNWLLIENLAALNRAVSHGLWNGRAKVFEFGSKALNGTEPYSKFWSTSGAALNFHIAVGGNVFVGTEVSSYSIDLLSTRFSRGNLRNYKYLPSGLQEWTSERTENSPAFIC